MTNKILHGNFTPVDMASVIYSHFNRGNLEVQRFGADDQVIVQVRTRRGARSGGDTAIGITFQSFEDGVIVEVGKQMWAGIAASLGYSALAALHNPLNLINRIDDIAQDIEYLSLEDEIWRVLESNAAIKGSKFELSDRIKRITCEYCLTANPVDASACIACGAPMGNLQPSTCKHCGYILKASDRVCPNCKSSV